MEIKEVKDGVRVVGWGWLSRLGVALHLGIWPTTETGVRVSYAVPGIHGSMKRLAVVLLLLLGLVTGCNELTKMKMDAEVDRLCASDGGLKIYETVSLPPEKFNKYNQINFYHPTQGENTLGPEYIWKWPEKFLHPGGDPNASPRMWRDHIQLYRRADGKLLGESISYSRYGGDLHFLNELVGGPPESHHRCLEDKTGDGPLLKGVFIKQTETRRTK